MFRQLGTAEMYGAGGQKRVPDEFVRSFAVAVPPLQEQLLLSSFLDRETAKIDALVMEQERLIELLKEKRQAVITQAVTKGLNPNAPMKPSGIEWLGDVPAHWEVMRVKNVTSSIEQGWSPQCEDYPVTSPDEWGVLKVGCVNGGAFNENENKALPVELTPIPELGIEFDDVLISRANTRELVGSAAVARTSFPRLMLCDKLYRIRVNPQKIVAEFLTFYLGTRIVRSHIEAAATGASSSMLNIGQGTILELPISLPSALEQHEIVDAIWKGTNKFGSLIAEAESLTALLRERRTAVVDCAVTGKIDVSGDADRWG